MNRALVGIVAASLMMVLPNLADARSWRPDQVPNGPDFGCTLCHQTAGGDGMRNSLGFDVLDTLMGDDVDWSAIYSLDSDGDGYTNGEELGDPDGSWTIGTAHPDFGASHPAIAGETPCGNGSVEGPEDCDGSNLAGMACTDMDFDSGDLACLDCVFDTSACSLDTCGNGAIDDGEQCDGGDLQGQDCAMLGFEGGTLSCSGSCDYDTSACDSGPEPECGNGTREEGEQCDGDDLNGASCRARGYAEGDLSCNDSCRFDESACQGSADAMCGNGFAERGEDCDGDDFGGVTCWILGYGGGELSCRNNCTFNESSCNDEEPWGDVGGFPGNADAGGGGFDTGTGDAGMEGSGSGGGDGGGGGGGCSAAPNRGSGAGALLLFGLVAAGYRRRRSR